MLSAPIVFAAIGAQTPFVIMFRYYIFILSALFFMSCKDVKDTVVHPHYLPEQFERNAQQQKGQNVDENERIAPIVQIDSLSENYALEIPQGNTFNSDQLLQRKSYICLYDSAKRCAKWSSWHLTKEHADGPYKRKQLHIQGGYLEDGDNLINRQLLSDWTDVKGYDHGHLCPSGDNKWDLDAMKQTFYLSNMCVQNSQLNQGPWERLESTCREWAKKFGELYIICGPIFEKSSNYSIGNNLHTPNAFFKVVYRPNPEPLGIGFVYDNITPDIDDKLEMHTKSIDEIESITGYDFFWSLPDDIENEVEASADLKMW